MLTAQWMHRMALQGAQAGGLAWPARAIFWNVAEGLNGQQAGSVAEQVPPPPQPRDFHMVPLCRGCALTVAHEGLCLWREEVALQAGLVPRNLPALHRGQVHGEPLLPPQQEGAAHLLSPARKGTGARYFCAGGVDVALSLPLSSWQRRMLATMQLEPTRQSKQVHHCQQAPTSSQSAAHPAAWCR